MSKPLLSINNLCVDMRTETGTLEIIRDVSFSLDRGETVGIVGESGSGKSVTCMSIMRLLDSPPAIYRQGTIDYDGADILTAPEAVLKDIRGAEISMIFQEALSALNPVRQVGVQAVEALRFHGMSTDRDGKQAIINLFQRVGIPDAAERYHQYPHQLSGGLQQRVMIAMALACSPSILIADEPTTALDVTIQIQILELLKEIQRENQMGLIFVSHDLGVIAEVCERVLVMYAGQIVESGTVSDLFSSPKHPYTQVLLNTIPSLTRPRKGFSPIPGQIPFPGSLPTGCCFHPRCNTRENQCVLEAPPLKPLSPKHQARCWLAQ